MIFLEALGSGWMTGSMGPSKDIGKILLSIRVLHKLQWDSNFV
jgi:hypothetical protein